MATATPLNCDVRGMEMTLYFNSGDVDTPVWVEHLGITGDLTIGETEDEEEVARRSRDRAVKEYGSGETDLSITGTQVVDPEYIGFQVLYAARTNGEPQDLMVLTQPIDTAGAVGWRGKFWNKDRTFNGPTTGSQTQAFNLRPAACNDTPVRNVKISAANTPDFEYDPTEVDSVISST